MSARTFQPNTRLSGKPCFVVCYLPVGTMVHVFAVLYTGTPTSDTDYHPKGMPFLSSQNIIYFVWCRWHTLTNTSAEEITV